LAGTVQRHAMVRCPEKDQVAQAQPLGLSRLLSVSFHILRATAHKRD
jgi:hypothetical protein